MRYTAFMSYSHAADAGLASAVQSALHRLARPLGRRRAVWIWRDKTSLPVNPALWASIEAALADSGYFLLIASPDSASSFWVKQEVEWWLKNRPRENLLIVLANGEVEWDSSRGCFEADKTTALPDSLRDCYQGDPPLYVDLRWVKSKEQLSLRHTQFREAILDIAAALHGKSKEDLDGEDIRQQRKTLRLAWMAAAVILAFAIAAGFAAYKWYDQSQVAERRRKEADEQRLIAVKARDAESAERKRAEQEQKNAERQAEIALARQMLAQSRLLSAQSPDLQDLSVLSAVEGLRRLHVLNIRTVAADHALRTALGLQPRLLSKVPLAGDVERVLAAPSGRYFAARTKNSTAVYAAGERRPLAEIPSGGATTAWAFGARRDRFGIGDGRGVWVVDLAQRNVSQLAAKPGAGAAIRFSSDLDHVAILQTGAKAILTVRTLPAGEEVSHDIVPGTWTEAVEQLNRTVPAPLRDGVRELLGGLAFRRVRISEDFGVRQRIVGPGGKYLIAYGNVDEAGMIYIYDPDEASEIGVHPTGETKARIISSPDGRHIAIAVNDTVRLLRVPPRTDGGLSRVEALYTIRTEAPAGLISFSRDSRTMITVAGRTARAWHVATGDEICRIAHDEPIRAADATARRLFAVAGGSAHVWSCDAGALAAGDGLELRGALDPGGRLVAAVLPQGVVVRRIADNKDLAVLKAADRGHHYLVWSPNGARLAGGRHGVPITVWDWPSGRLVRLRGDRLAGQPLAFSGDGRYLAVGESYRYIEVRDLRSGIRAGKIDVRFQDDMILGDNARYLAARDFDNMRRVWNVKTGALLNAGARVSAVALMGSGGWFAGWRDGLAEIRDVETGTVRAKLKMGDAPRRMALSAEGRLLAAAVGDRVTVWETATGTQILEAPLDYPAEDLAFNAADSTLATVTGRTLQLWDCERRTEIARIPIDEDWYDDPSVRPWLGFLPAARLVHLGYESRNRFWAWQPWDMIEAACAVLRPRPSMRALWRTHIGGVDPGACVAGGEGRGFFGGLSEGGRGSGGR